MKETLNIDNAILPLVLKALNKNKQKIDAAKDLGVSYKWLYLYIKEHKLYLTEPKWVKDNEKIKV